MRKKLSVVLAGLAACSSVTVRKVPWRGDYANWDNAKQREADAIEGERYYAPWPHLVITKAFPVDVDSCFVSATLTAGGRYVSFDSGILQGLNARLPGPGREEGPPVGAFDPDARLGGEAPSSTGGGIGPVPLSDFMSIEYLPNEREQYAIAVTPGLFSPQGKAELASRSLSGTPEGGAAALPALARGVLDDVVPRLDRALPNLAEATRSAVGVSEGTRVTVRVHAVRYARPGVYPRCTKMSCRAPSPRAVESPALDWARPTTRFPAARPTSTGPRICAWDPSWSRPMPSATSTSCPRQQGRLALPPS